MVAAASAPDKPRLRGVLHQWAIGAAALAGAYLVSIAPTARQMWAGAVYAASLVALFSVSALYHRINWSPSVRAVWRRADHAMIFVLIAGTYTPFMMVPMPQPQGLHILLFVWSGAAVGIAQSLFWLSAPKALLAILAVAVGWSGVVYWDEAYSHVPTASFLLLAAGGVAYTLGAVAYALKRPNPVPGVFGYHEVFHALTIVAAIIHWFSVWVVIHP